MSGYKMIKTGKEQDWKSVQNKLGVDSPDNLLEKFHRYSITKSDMPLCYTVNIVIYHGMGDFSSYYAHHEDKEYAIILALLQYIHDNQYMGNNYYDYVLTEV
jgi:hypothetical protein